MSMDSLSNFFEKTVKSTPPTIPFGVVACTLIYQTTFLEVAVYIYKLVFKKVDISKIYIFFASLRETKEKTKGIYIFIYISEMSTFLKTRAYILSLYIKTGSSHFKTTKLYYSWQGEVEEIAVTGKLRFSIMNLLASRF